jgi:hypothetical protein
MPGFLLRDFKPALGRSRETTPQRRKQRNRPAGGALGLAYAIDPVRSVDGF